MHNHQCRNGSFGTFLFILLTLIFFSGCSGIHLIPIHEGESIEWQFDGPITLSYVLEDGTTKDFVIEHQLELILVNHYDDGNDTEISSAERLYTYFRVTEEGGIWALGLDPELKNPLNGDPQFPDPTVIDSYAQTAELEFINQEGGLLDNLEPVQIEGTFLGATAHRYDYYCVDPVGTVLFTYDLEVPRLCTSPNHVENSQDLVDYHYTRQEILDLTADNYRSMLATVPADSLSEAPPLVIKIVNVNFDPDNQGGDTDGNGLDPLVDPNSSTNPAEGGCGLQRQVEPGPSYLGGLWLLTSLLGWGIFRNRIRKRSNI